MKLIKTEDEYSAALKRIETLIEIDPDVNTGEADELEILGVLIEKYEDEKYLMELPDPAEAKKFKMKRPVRMEGFPCVNCGKRDGTVVPAHYSGDRKSHYGHGMRKKVSNILCAALCMECHQFFDRPDIWGLYYNKLEHSELFLHLIALTLCYLEKEGYNIEK
jgi:hypothetical protein